MKASHERERADHEANGAREDLLATLEELERRRARALDLRGQLAKHPGAVLLAAGGVVVAVGGAVVATRALKRSSSRRAVRRRWRGFQRAWEHPNRVASRSADAPVLVLLARKLLLAFAAGLGAQVSRRAASALLPSADGRGEGAHVGERAEAELE